MQSISQHNDLWHHNIELYTTLFHATKIIIKNSVSFEYCLMQLKHALDIEYNICKNNENRFLKYKFVFDNI